MENSRKIMSFLKIGVLLLCLIGTPVGFYLHKRQVRAAQEPVIQEYYWQISLPKQGDIEKIYKKHTAYGPHGEAVHYSIYSADRGQINLAMRTDTGQIEDVCLEYCGRLEIPDEYLPDFSHEYRWQKFERNQDTLILLYFVKEKQLHIFEDFF